MKKAILFLSIILTLPVYAESPRVAVLDFVGKGISEKDASAVADFFRTDLVNTGRFTVLDRGNMNEILKEQEFQATACTDTACAVEIGKFLSMEYMFSGTVTKFGNKYVVSASMIGVETGQIMSSKRETVSEFSDMIDATGKIVNAFVRQLKLKPGESSEPAPAGLGFGSNWGTLKWVTFIGGAALLAGGGAMNYLAYSAQSDADDYFDNEYMKETGTPGMVSKKYDTYQEKVDDANFKYYTAYGLYGAGVALLAWWYFIPTEDTSVSYIPEMTPILASSNKGYRFAWTCRF